MKKSPLELVQFSYNIKKEELESSCQKYGWKHVGYIDIINMDEKEIPYIHPYCFACLQNVRSVGPQYYRTTSLFVGLACTFPDRVMKNLNIYQLSVFSKRMLESYSYEVLEFLEEKFKGQKMDYHPDMHFYLYESDPYKLIQDAIATKNAYKKFRNAAVLKKDLSVFRSLKMISIKDVARIWRFRIHKTQWTLIQNKMIEYLKDFEINPSLSDDLYQSIKNDSNNMICDFDKVNEYTFKDYQGKKTFEDMDEIVTYKELFEILVSRGFLSTDSKEENAKRFLYLRYDYFPHITAPHKSGNNLYFLSEIEEIVQNIEKTGIIPIETSYDLMSKDERHPVCQIIL